MKIGIDISQIVYEGTGVARFTSGLIDSILDYDNDNHWTFFFSSLRQNLDPLLEEKIRNKKFSLIKWKIPPTILSLLWNDFHTFSRSYMLHVTSFNDLDWFITSDWTEPPSQKIKKAAVVHDLVYLRYPEMVDKKIRDTQQKRLNWVKKESEIIFADSKTTKNDLVELLHVDAKKIYVNYPGVDITKPSEEKIKRTLKKHDLDKPFILTVGKLEPRKNIKKLIEAFIKTRSNKIDLVIVGPRGWENLEQFNNETVKQSNVKFLGFVPDSDLFALYSSCLFFIFPSLWEGFGYPVVEAMKLGTPVATSNTSSLKEIGENAALLFDPHNLDEITHSINTLIQNKKLRDELSKKGLERSKLFTWKNYYRILIKVLRSQTNH